LLYDSDRAGLQATFRSGDELLRHGMSVQVVTLPEGEDPDSFVDKHGREQLATQLNAAIDVFERKVQLLERAGWFGDLRRKRRALDRLLPTIRATSDPLTRDMYVTRASEAAGVSRELLLRELGDAAPEGPNATSVERQPPARARREEFRVSDRRERERRGSAVLWPIERQLIHVALHDRPSLETMSEQLGPEDFNDPMVRDIYKAILAAPAGASATELASKLQPESVAVLAELLDAPLGEGLDVQAIVEGGIAKLRGLGIRRRLGEIEREMSIASEEEKNRLISEKDRLNRELTALGGGTFKSFDRTR
jgi:DNA primase